jgi:hypothetical protein
MVGYDYYHLITRIYLNMMGLEEVKKPTYDRGDNTPIYYSYKLTDSSYYLQVSHNPKQPDWIVFVFVGQISQMDARVCQSEEPIRKENISMGILKDLVVRHRTMLDDAIKKITG